MAYKHNPLTHRTFVHKNPAMKFFCPLCRTQRAMTNKLKLSKMNFAQIVLITGAVMAALYPIMGLKSLFTFFVVWFSFEASARMRFRKEIACPHCGFDASWYKRDVKVARRLVHEFWDQRGEGAAQVAPEQEEAEINPYL
jgi:hypothetical protein